MYSDQENLLNIFSFSSLTNHGLYIALLLSGNGHGRLSTQSMLSLPVFTVRRKAASVLVSNVGNGRFVA